MLALHFSDIKVANEERFWCSHSIELICISIRAILLSSSGIAFGVRVVIYESRQKRTRPNVHQGKNVYNL